MLKQEIAQNAPTQEELDELASARPRTRADCINGPRPCPFVGCRHNLLLDVVGSGSIKEYKHQAVLTCALDAAERGGMTLSEVGYIFKITRERTRQIECGALRSLSTQCKNPRSSD